MANLFTKFRAFSRKILEKTSFLKLKSNLKYITIVPLLETLPETVSEVGNSVENDLKIPIRNLNKEVEDAVLFKGGSFLMNLIPLLEEIIVEISKQYRTCLINQMNLIENFQELEIIPVRIKAAELKNEILKYESLVKSVAQSVYGQAAFALLSGDNIETLELLQTKLQALEKLVENEINENKKFEYKLLAANCANITK